MMGVIKCPHGGFVWVSYIPLSHETIPAIHCTSISEKSSKIILVIPDEKHTGDGFINAGY
jgi:hypothetical protein